MTRRTTIPPGDDDAGLLGAAGDWIAGGGIVAFPTDTFYGLAVDPRREGAVQALFALKGRAENAPLPLVAASMAQVERTLGPVNAATRALADAFWPGPLSMVVDAPPAVVRAVHAGTGSVAVRVPAHGVARALAEAAGTPIVSTSANRSGAPPAREPADLGWLESDPRVWIVDAGATPGGAPSTIVDVRSTPPVLIREGAVAWSRVLEFLHA